MPDQIARDAFLAQARGATFSDRSITALSTGQAAGTSPVLPANARRRAVIVKASKVCSFSFRSGETEGMIDGPAFERHGAACPTNALYVHDLTTSDALRIEEGE